jgi:secretion/DNA translocation related TadE-like protein
VSDRSACPGRTRSQRGSASVLATFLVGAVVVASLVAAWWAGAVSVRHRAGSAADLAALAAAQAWVSGQTPCGAARRLALANDGVLVGCWVEGAAVRVEVEVAARLRVLGRDWTLTSRRSAWAGPVTAVSHPTLTGPPR